MAGLEITTSIGCPISCKYCPQSELLKANYVGPKLMSLDLFSRYVKTVPTSVNIHFSGFSESWLAPQATDMVKYALKKGHKVTIYTTLVGMKLEDVEVLKGFDFERFEVHVTDNEGNMNIKVDEEYLTLIEKVTEISEVCFRVLGSTTTYPEIESILNRPGIDFQVGKTLQTRAGSLTLEEFPAEVLSGGRSVKLGHKIRCTKGLKANVLLPNGLVVACCQDFGLQLLIGNLLEIPYSDLFKTEQYRRLKERLQDSSDSSLICRRCSYSQVIKR